MFMISVRASTLKFFGVVVLTLGILTALLVNGGFETAALTMADTEVTFSGMKTNEDRVAFLKNAGLTVEEKPIEEKEFVMPEDFDRILVGYNEIQKAQGLDLSKYKKRRVTRYTYLVKDYEAPDGYEGDVYANLLIYRNRVIGCDVSSAEPTGFVEPLLKTSEKG